MDGYKSATYRISGRVVDEDGRGLKGIHVEMLSEKEGELLIGDSSNETDTDSSGRFEVEALSNNVTGVVLALEFTDPSGTYETSTWSKQINGVTFTDGEGLYLGTYQMALGNIVMRPKEDPEASNE